VPETAFLTSLQTLVVEANDRSVRAKRIAEAIASQRNYRWVGLYEVTPTEIGMIACTGATPPAFPRFPATQGLCGAAVATRATVNSGNVQEDSRWLTTFGTTRSEIIVPVFAPGLDRPIGLIDVESDHFNAFSSDDERFLTACASLLAALYR
jgi:putative methionine-R-sulfoxide reductase with GAF domain